MSPTSLASGLLVFTGFAHVLEHWLRSQDSGMLVAGIVYFALGVWLRRPSTPALIASAVLPALGGLAGTQQLVASVRFDPILAGMIAIDAVVVVCCVMALMRGRPAGASA
ncbi:MAG TPA: hypothetical protein VFT98_09420 [Myxococcota bacterium]|nr:hypothetical protein [Myxococcota bacterium]